MGGSSAQYEHKTRGYLARWCSHSNVPKLNFNHSRSFLNFTHGALEVRQRNDKKKHNKKRQKEMRRRGDRRQETTPPPPHTPTTTPAGTHARTRHPTPHQQPPNTDPKDHKPKGPRTKNQKAPRIQGTKHPNNPRTHRTKDPMRYGILLLSFVQERCSRCLFSLSRMDWFTFAEI